MPELPSGTVTFLSTDIEGSTRLVQRLGEGYAAVLAEQQRLLRAAFAAHGGYEVDTQGDSFFVSFARATDALAAAVEAQRALLATTWPDGVNVRVRMGLHTGEAQIAGERYVGLAVHRAARVGAAAHGGQILLSAATQAMVQDRLPAAFVLRDLGAQRLKDFDRPELLAQLIAPGLPDEFPPPKAPAREPAGLAIPPPPPIFGREREQALLHERLLALREGHGGLVLIGGEAGIGKTTLAETLAYEATAGGLTVLIGRAYDLTETPPYGPWRDLFAHYRAADGGPSLPASFAPGGEAVAPASQAALFAATIAFFEELARQRSLLLLLDDLHWADSASLELLRALAHELVRLPLLILTTYRADELHRHHPLYNLVPLFMREARADLLNLRRLDRDHLRAIVRAQHHLPEAEEGRLIDYLRDHAEGNPFYTGELLRSLQETGLLRQGPGADTWGLGDLTQARVPPLLRQVIDGRLARLTEETQQLLAIASTIGQGVSLTLWGTVAGVTEEALLAASDEAIAARLLEASDDGTDLRFVHALIREALYEGLLPPRRRSWHRRVAEALLAEARPDPDNVASHLQRAGDPRAAAWLIRAGERAQRAYALLIAAERFEAALTLLETQGGEPRERAILLYRLARMRRYADPRGAIAYLDDAADLAHEATDTLLVAYISCARGSLRCTTWAIRRGLTELAAGMGFFDTLTAADQDRLTALQLTLGDPADPHHYRGALASWLALAGRYAEAQVQGERVLADERTIARGVGTSARANAFRSLAAVHAALGAPDAARQAYDNAAAAYRAVEHWYQVGNTLGLQLYEVILPYAADDLLGRRQLADGATAAWERASEALADLPPQIAHLPLLLLEGEWAVTREIALAVRAPGHRTQWRPFATGFLARLAQYQGDFALAWSLVRERLPDGPTTEPGDVIFLDALAMQRLAATLALDAADLPTARAWLDAHDRWILWSDSTLGRAEGCTLWARYHLLSGHLDLVDEAATEALREASEPRQPLALLAAHRANGEIATARGQGDAAIAHLDEALALAAACASPYERAVTLLGLAEAQLATGACDAATATLIEARAILERLAAPPALARATVLAAQLAAVAAPVSADLPAGLSAREVEVLRLVAQGLTDAEVAAELSISPRTIGGHLRSVYSKIGVSSRAAATRFALDHGLR